MSTLNPNNPIIQIVAALLIGVLVGSGTTAMIVGGGAPEGEGIDPKKLDEMSNITRDMSEIIKAIQNEIMRIEKKLDENTINVDGEYIKYLKEILAAINNEVNQIEKKLDTNGIDVNGTFSTNLFNQLNQIMVMLRNLNVTTINQNITNVNQTINNVYNTVNNIYNVVNNINNTVVNNYNFIQNIYQTVNNIDVTINQIYDILVLNIVEQLTFVNVTVYNIYSLTINIYDILVVIQQVLGDVYTIVVNIQNDITQIINTLTIINIKTQKEVIIDVEHISDTPDPLVREYYVMVSLEGEGGLESTSLTNVLVLNVTDANIFIQETNVPGLYRIIIFMPETTPPGTYILVIESEIVLTFPDGSQEVFRGREITTFLVW